jgi:hypothetical protein
MPNSDKNCLLCSHSQLWPEEPGYSEMTPGSPANWSCDKNCWKDDPLTLRKEDFLKLIDQAKTCKYFKLFNKE